MKIPSNSHTLCSVFGSNKESVPLKSLPLYEILLAIKNCNFHTILNSAREHYAEGNKKQCDKLINSLPAFTICGTFNPIRNIAHFKSYSGFIILEINEVDCDQLQSLFKKICEMPFTFSCFVSASGKGLKVIVRASGKAKQHKKTFTQVRVLYEKELEVFIDKSGIDVARTCSYSCDKNIFVNESAEIFSLKMQLCPQLSLFSRDELSFHPRPSQE